MTLLREYNRQRVKSFAEKVREEVISADPDEAYESLIEHRREQSEVVADTLKIRGEKRRAEISSAKQPFLRAIKRVIKRRRKFWPLSDRQIHYALLNDPPLIHASKPDSTYANDQKSYKALTDLLTRARLEGEIGMNVIADPTRPVSPEWSTPQDLFDGLDAEFGFTTDVCATPENAKCATFYTRDDDGLSQTWRGVCWMNPPYGREIGAWVAKAHQAAENGATVVCLVPARTDTRWWQQHVMPAMEADPRNIRFLPGRLKFGGATNSAPFPSAVVVFQTERATQ